MRTDQDREIDGAAWNAALIAHQRNPSEITSARVDAARQRITRAMIADEIEELTGERPETGETGEYVSRCPACGDVIDYCQGHGEIGDPIGAAVLAAHDMGRHRDCHPDGCDIAADCANDSHDYTDCECGEGECATSKPLRRCRHCQEYA